jgi:hypothetical protein
MQQNHKFGERVEETSCAGVYLKSWCCCSLIWMKYFITFPNGLSEISIIALPCIPIICL